MQVLAVCAYAFARLACYWLLCVISSLSSLCLVLRESDSGCFIVLYWSSCSCFASSGVADVLIQSLRSCV